MCFNRQENANHTHLEDELRRERSWMLLVGCECKELLALLKIWIGGWFWGLDSSLVAYLLNSFLLWEEEESVPLSISKTLMRSSPEVVLIYKKTKFGMVRRGSVSSSIGRRVFHVIGGHPSGLLSVMSCVGWTYLVCLVVFGWSIHRTPSLEEVICEIGRLFPKEIYIVPLILGRSTCILGGDRWWYIVRE